MLKKAISLLVVILNGVTAQADVGKKLPSGYTFSRPLPISLGFFPEFMTNQSVSNFHIALEKDSGWVFDKGHEWLNPQQVWTRVAYKYLIYPIIAIPFYKALRMSSDAYGKASRIKAMGEKAIYVNNSYESYAENYWTMLGKNIWKSYKGSITGSVETIDVMVQHKPEVQTAYQDDLNKLHGAVAELRRNDAVDPNKLGLNTEVAALRNKLDDYLRNKGKVLLRAAGYNARMAHTRNIEDTLWYDKGGHLAQLSNHTANKLAYTLDSIGVFFQRNHTGQANSDLGRIEAAYKSIGVDLTWKEMGAYGAVTFLGSAEFWGRFFEEFDYISSGDAYVKAPEIAGFRLPNLGFYLTSHGPSYQINTGYRYGQDLFFPLAVEYVFKGPNKMIEIIMGARKQFAWMDAYLHAEVVMNWHQSAFGGKVAAGLKPTKDIFVDIGIQCDHSDTLDGERNIRLLKDTPRWCPSISATVGLLF